MPVAAQFLRCQKAFLLTTAAQNMHAFLRKSPLHEKHFFVWLKTENFSNACGTSTLKSLLPQAFAVSNVHPRPRKRLARCTLDCGFKTPESPALRGFEAERCPITGTSLYLVLKSNGLRHPKNLPVKFGFSSKSVPANIAKKLPPQVPSQTISHHDFQLRSQTAHVRLHGRKRVHTRLSEKNRTQRLTRRNRGLPSLGHSAACVTGEIATERTAGESGCTPVACVRFLRHRSPAGLRKFYYLVCCWRKPKCKSSR